MFPATSAPRRGRAITLVLACVGFSVQGAPAQGVITTFAGSPWQFRGDGGTALNAPLGRVHGKAMDAAGNFYFSDTDNSRVMRVSPDGTLTVVAGNGLAGFSGDGGPALSAALSGPRGIALDSAGNTYIADVNNQRICRVSLPAALQRMPAQEARAFPVITGQPRWLRSDVPRRSTSRAWRLASPECIR